MELLLKKISPKYLLCVIICKKKKGDEKMKIYNALAIRDFDESRILTRPFFKDFGFGNLTDEEILQSLKPADSDSIDDLEEKTKKTKELRDEVNKFQRLIQHHQQRYEKIAQYIMKMRNIDSMYNYLALCPVEYSKLGDNLFKLFLKLQNQYLATEKSIQITYRKIFTERLRKYRELSGLTQKELGELVQISPVVMSRYATNEREIPIHTLTRIAKVLGISTDKLLGIT